MTRSTGVYLPLVTPFLDGAVDLESVRRMIEHYAAFDLAGLILFGTTGESPTVEQHEQLAMVSAVLELTGGRLPVHVGVGGNSTASVVKSIAAFEPLGVAGYLVVAPYYNRPSQDGMVRHFQAVAAATERPIIVYNVPYRTGVNLSNESLFEIVASTPNIRAVKDSTGNITQSLDLLRDAPAELSVLTGEDPLYFTSLANGAAGAILASAHLATATFVEIAQALEKQELIRAREAWRGVAPLIPLLFGEANPMPLKHCLWRLGLLRSAECRLPLTSVSPALASKLDAIIPGLPG